MPLITVDDTGVSVSDYNATLADAKAKVDAEPALGPDFDDSAGTPYGQDQAAKAERLANIQAAIATIATALDPDSATGVLLDNVCSLTGTIRNGAAPSTIPVTLSGTPSTVVPAGRIVTLDSIGSGVPGQQWQTQAEYTIGGGGTIAGVLECVDDGPYYAGITTGWTIVSTVSGWDSVASTAEATIGRFVEANAALRRRRKTELGSGGSATLPAMASNLVQDNANITAARVFDVTNDTSFNPGEVEVLISRTGGMTDAQVRAALHLVVPAGTVTLGTISGTHTDSGGRVFTYAFSEPTSKNQWVRVQVSTTGATVALPSTWQTDVSAAIVAEGGLLATGDDVIPGKFESVVWSALPSGSCTGVTVTVSQNGVSYTADIVDILPREQAAFDTSRVSFV